MSDVLIELDPRRRTTVRPGRHSKYLVHEEEDGTLIWEPAETRTVEELRLLQRPDIMTAIEKARAEIDAGLVDGSEQPIRRRKMTQ